MESLLAFQEMSL